MIEDYEYWDYSIRTTLIELADYMTKDTSVSNNIDFLIEFAWANGADIDIVNDAKQELKKLRSKSEADLVGWARINDRGDLYDPRLVYNPYVPDCVVIPLYANKKEYYEKYGKSSK